MTSIAEVDQLIAGWQERLRLIDTNLLALEQDSTMVFLQRMVASGTGLDGVTKERAGPAITAFANIPTYRSLLDDVVQKAVKLRGRTTFLLSEKTLAEIVALLSGPSIALETSSLPLAQRDLLSTAQTISPDALLREMVRAYEAARDIVTAVGQTWDRRQRDLDTVQKSIADLQQQAAAQDLSVPELDSLTQELARLGARMLSDPLGAADDWSGHLQPRLEAVRSSIGQVQEKRARITAQLGEAQALIGELADQCATCERLFEELRIGIARSQPVLVPVSTGEIDGLRSWLQTLEGLAISRKWDALGVGLTRWLEAATAYKTQLAMNAETNGKPLAERDDLRGLLSARQAQASMLLGRGILLPVETREYQARAEALLNEKPADLDEARSLVAKYDQAVQAAMAHHRS